MNRSLRYLLIGTVLFALTLAAYWQVLGHDFIAYYDDGDYVTDNPHIQAGLTGETVRWAFTTTWSANWHPLTWISHAADCTLYRLNPEGHHLTSLLFHAANVVLLFLALSLMTGCFWRSAFVAGLFAIHPLHVESVAWVAERKDVLSTFFWLLAMLAYWHYARRPSIGRYAPVLIAFALGLLSKPMLVTLPLVLLMLDYWPLARKKRLSSLIVEKIPLLALSAASCVITFIAQSGGGAVGRLDDFTLLSRIANALVGCTTYVWKMLWPQNLAVFYPYPAHGPVFWKTLISAMLLLVVSLIALSLRRRRQYLLVGWLWFLVTLVPVIGLVQVGGQAIADRYTYVPLIGLFVIAVWAISDAFRRIKPLAPALGIVVVVALTMVTLRQVPYWQTGATLFEHALESTSSNYVMEDLFGLSLADEGKFDEATAHYNAALKINPDYAPAHNDLGIALATQGRIEEGVHECRQALRLDPESAAIHYNLGKALALKGDLGAAASEYEEALRIKPDDARAHNNLGNVRMQQGKLKEAENEFRAALAVDPRFVETHNSLASLLNEQGRLDEAAEESQIAIRLDPCSAAAHYNLGVVYQEQDRLDEALEEYRQAVNLDSDLAAAHNNLAVVYYFKGDYAQAWKEVELCRKLGGNPHPGFIELLAQKMPQPGR